MAGRLDGRPAPRSQTHDAEDQPGPDLTDGGQPGESGDIDPRSRGEAVLVARKKRGQHARVDAQGRAAESDADRDPGRPGVAAQYQREGDYHDQSPGGSADHDCRRRCRLPALEMVDRVHCKAATNPLLAVATERRVVTASQLPDIGFS